MDYYTYGLFVFAMAVLCIVLVWVLWHTHDDPPPPPRHPLGQFADEHDEYLFA